MKKGQSVSYDQLNSAVRDVQGELERVGLWYEGASLTKTEVYWCRFPQWPPDALGYFVHQADGIWRLLGYEAGNIYIPSWVLAQGLWQNRGSLRDVVRHEYGHALIWHHPKLGRSKAFKEAFHASYDSGEGNLMPPNCYVSEYAKTNPAEDFCETFMCWLRNPTRRWGGPNQLKKKFQYMRKLCKLCGQ